LCFERRFYKQNSVNRLKSNILALPKIFGLAAPLRHMLSVSHLEYTFWKIQLESAKRYSEPAMRALTRF